MLNYYKIGDFLYHSGKKSKNLIYLYAKINVINVINTPI